MCRRPAKICTELGPDPATWSPTSSLWPKDWFEASIDAFSEAYRLAQAGKLESAETALATTRASDLNVWYDVHAQNVGRFRQAHFGAEDPVPTHTVLDSSRSVTRFEKALFVRDGYRCRYCETRVVPGSVFKRMQTLLGKEVFDATSRSNSARNGVKLAFSAALDHVVPHSRGGSTDPDNLVTACWPCNYGKAEYTLAELGLNDPRDRQPVVDQWQGLTDVLICQGCGSGKQPQLIYPHPAGGNWHTDFCMPPPTWRG